MEKKLTTSEIRSVCVLLPVYSDVHTRDIAARAIRQLLDEVNSLTNIVRTQNFLIEGSEEVIKILEAKLADFMRGA